MTKEVVTIRSLATVAEAIQLMQQHGWRSLIVERDNDEDAYGIITETDIVGKVTAIGNDPEHIQVSQVMTKPCIVVNPDLSVENIIKLFANHRLLRAPVIQGKLLGIISVSDILMKSHAAERLHAVYPDLNLPELVQQAATGYSEDGSHLQQRATAWNAIEGKLSQLSQQHTEDILKIALNEYLAAFEELTKPEILDNLCSG